MRCEWGSCSLRCLSDSASATGHVPKPFKESQAVKLFDGSRAAALILGLLSGPRGGPTYKQTAAMPPRTSESSVGEEADIEGSTSRGYRAT